MRVSALPDSGPDSLQRNDAHISFLINIDIRSMAEGAVLPDCSSRAMSGIQRYGTL